MDNPIPLSQQEQMTPKDSWDSGTFHIITKHRRAGHGKRLNVKLKQPTDLHASKKPTL